MKNYSKFPASSREEEQANEHYRAAQKATRKDSWAVHGICSSADFLKSIFEDEGDPLEDPAQTSSDPRTYLESNDDVLRSFDYDSDQQVSH
jgi:hypothetical protein